MKKWLSVAAIVVLCLALVVGVACGGDGEGEEEGVTELKMGCGTPMSGIYGAVVGLPSKYAFELAAEDIGVFTVGGEQYRWNLIFEENHFSSAGGVASATKLITDDNVEFMRQTGADAGLAAAPICQEKGIILDTSGAGPEQFSADTPLLFQVTPTWAINIPPFFDWLSKEHPEVKRVAIASTEDATGYAAADACTAAAEHYGLEVVVKDFSPAAGVDVMPIATKIMRYDPDLFVGSTTTYQAMRDMGFEGLAMTYYWLDSYALQVGWDTCQGYLICMPHPWAGLWPEAEALGVEFAERHDVEFAPSSFWALNVIYVITDTLREAGTVTGTDKIVETMETGTFDTIVGPLRYGGEVLNGVGHMVIWPSPIYEVVGEDEYRVLAMYTVEETEAIIAEVYK
jgi:ABC-type branched-subunit amino acid transport system substrate-binding protein